MQDQSHYLPPAFIVCRHLILANAIQPSSHSSYSAGLVRFIRFCDEYDIPKNLCMPASEALLSIFITTQGTGCYKYWLSNLHIHHRLCRKSLGSIRRSIIRIPQPTNHPIVIICTPCTIPEPNEGQDRQIDRIYPLPGHIYPLPLAHMIRLDRFDQGPLETLPKVTHHYIHDYTQFPQPKRLPQWVNVTLDLAGRPPDHNSSSIHSTHFYTMPVVSSHSYTLIYFVVTCINRLQGPIATS